MTKYTTPTSGAAEPDNVTHLPDGSAFAIASFPLPDSHWLYAPREYAEGADEPKELPRPILNHTEHREAVVAAIRYAVRGATMLGKETDFDPDALVQNAVYALCGPFGGRTTLVEKIALASTPAQPEVPAGCVAMPRAAISRAIEVLDWLPTSDSMQPLWAKQQAALDELRLSLAAAQAQPVAEPAQVSAVESHTAYAELPSHAFNIDPGSGGNIKGYSADQMRVFADATETLRTRRQTQAPAYNIVALSHLPSPDHSERIYGGHGNEIVHSYYTDHQMREYARQEVHRAEAAWQARASHGQAQPDSVQEDSLDAAFEAVRKRLCGVQRYSFVLDDDGLVRRVRDRAGNWIEFDEAHALLDPMAVDAARKQGATP